jgi:hypothetical protein
MKTYLLCLTVLLFGCSKKQAVKISEKETDQQQEVIHKISPELLIKEGVGIGNTYIGQNTAELTALGTPDLSDAAMGKAWLTWYSKKSGAAKEEFNIYTTYKDNTLREKVVRQIRITSPDFKTAGGVGNDASFASIKKAYPDLKTVGRYNNPESRKEVIIYDDISSGIAFEVDNSYGKKTCNAIIVHQRNKKVTDEYITLHPYMIVL